MTGNKRNKARALMVFLLVFVMGFSSVVVYGDGGPEGQDGTYSDFVGFFDLDLGGYFDLSEIDDFLLEYLGEEFVQNQLRSLEIFEQLHSVLLQSTDGRSEVYPDFFGGAYIDENGNLVILLTEAVAYDALGSGGMRDGLSDKGISFRFVEFSAAELESINDAIYEIISPIFGTSYCIYADNVVFWGIDDRTNRLVVQLEILTDEKITGFRENIFDSPALYFEQGERWDWGGGAENPSSFHGGEFQYYYTYDCDFDWSYAGFCYMEISASQTDIEHYMGIMPLSASVNPREHLWRGQLSRVRAGTMGFRVRCRDTNEVGFVAALHPQLALGNPVPAGTPAYATTSWAITGNRAGEVRRQSALTDSIFFVARNGTPSNNLQNGQTLSTMAITTFLQGQTILGFGAAEREATGVAYTRGTVIRRDGRLTTGTGIMSNLIVSSNRGRPGDSGGTTATITLATAGIIIGGPANGSETFFMPAYRVLDALRVNRY